MKSPVLASLLVAASLALAAPSFAADQFLADFHVAHGMKCETCHGPDKNNPATPDIDTCTQCHNTKQLVEKTKNVKPQNPHTSPHYGDQLECTNCHMGHEKSVDFCAQCHSFGFKVP